jgi:regulator of sigma E protease
MTLLIVILGLSFLILIHELGHFLAAKSFGLLVEEFGFGFPPRLFAKKIGETVYSLNLLPFGGFVKIYGEYKADDAAHLKRAFFAQKIWKKIAVILAGVLMNFLLGWFIISSVFMIGVPSGLAITEVFDGSPAAAAGLLKGDQILNFSSADDFVKFVQENKGREIVLNLKRSGKELKVNITPRLEPPGGQGALGVGFMAVGLERQPFFASILEGFKASVSAVAAIFIGLFQLILALFTKGQLLAGVVGPVGIFGVAGEAAGLGLTYFLQFIALISLNLFALNILPFPALDGGRFLFILFEKIKGSPLSPQFERSVNAAGFLLLLLLMIALTARDIGRLF